ncbi:hypothetical protein ASAP_0254 [Asaia bogorensis]|uniref:Uncharacterized protein n=1 Tax=Asaia bogorensis TaxID=91915 RepID=A0A060QB13_9PROT|nr:hypothetical protein ASAP_0254 [Asaia bogorensis]
MVMVLKSKENGVCKMRWRHGGQNPSPPRWMIVPRRVLRQPGCQAART